uniref:Ig-like domain-containing protein n=1 Tax=Sander lucioperca TaxID=283035 RepID=A0A8C9ZQ10_SANLU
MIHHFLCTFSSSAEAQKDNVLQPKGDVTATEGETVTLGCQYNSSSTNINLFWYKQDGNNSPKFILMRIQGDGGNTADEFRERFSSTHNSKLRSVPLKIQKLQLSDSAVYYCALRPTVTGNTKTLMQTVTRISPIWFQGFDYVAALICYPHACFVLVVLFINIIFNRFLKF